MVNAFSTYTDEATRRRRRAMGLPDEPDIDESAVLLEEFERRGLDPRPELSSARSPQELAASLKARLARQERGAAAQALHVSLPLSFRVNSVESGFNSSANPHPA